jgi:hypothetical protein
LGHDLSQGLNKKAMAIQVIHLDKAIDFQSKSIEFY